jgi:4,5-DOPA dioxygenase extradiol
MPVWFLAHGSPMLAVQDVPFTRMLRALPTSLPRPAAIVVVSAHWQARGGLRVTSAPHPATVHDFGGFDPELYTIDYPAPGDVILAARVVDLLSAANLTATPDGRQGFDHGAWVVLRHAFPAADVPVVEVSLPYPGEPAALLAIGAALAPLRREGVLLVGSGGLVHNLGTLVWDDENAPAAAWAAELDAWFGARIASLDIAALTDYRSTAPHATLGVPTTEHLDPAFVALGARLPEDRPVTLFEGFQHGTLSLRSFALQP